MTAISVQGALPVPIKVNGVPLTKITMSALTVEESLAAVSTLTEGQYVAIGELCSMLSFGHDDDTATPVTYEQLAKSSKQNMDYLQSKRLELEKKERLAVAVENTPA